MTEDAPITRVLVHYFPHWEPPEDRREWNQCLCPSHDENRPSASVSFEHDAIKCMACGFKGNVISIIMRKEGVRFDEAVKRAEEISGRSDIAISRERGRKPRGRRVFGESGAPGAERGKRGGQVPSWRSQ